MAINAQEVQGQWNQIRGQVKEKWGQLSDDDLTIQGGNVDQLIGRIQQKTGEGREAIEKYLGQLTNRASQTAESMRGYAQQAGQRLREGYGEFADAASDRYAMGEDMVRHHPGQSVASAFGVGLVVGVLVGLAIRSR